MKVLVAPGFVTARAAAAASIVAWQNCKAVNVTGQVVEAASTILLTSLVVSQQLRQLQLLLSFRERKLVAVRLLIAIRAAELLLDYWFTFVHSIVNLLPITVQGPSVIR